MPYEIEPSTKVVVGYLTTTSCLALWAGPITFSIFAAVCLMSIASLIPEHRGWAIFSGLHLAIVSFGGVVLILAIIGAAIAPFFT